MTTIILSTDINADIEKCFDVSRDIGINLISASGTDERVASGKFIGLCELNDEITREAKHFFIRQKLSVKITGMNKPFFFEDTMTKGAFRSMKHEHYYERRSEKTVMKDVLNYEVPFNFIGKIFDFLILKKYMTDFLKIRNLTIKQISEGKDFKS